jgi:hypothetical protein
LGAYVAGCIQLHNDLFSKVQIDMRSAGVEIDVIGEAYE